MGKRAARCAFAVAALAVAGCGSPSSAPAGEAAPRETPAVDGGPLDGYAGGAPPDDAAPKAATGPTFPLTLRRTGGRAGFDDTIVLEAGGRLTVDGTAIHGRVCALGPTQRRELLAALSTLRLAGTSTPPASPVDRGESEPIRITVTDVDGRPVDLTDPSLGAVSGMVAALVSDVTLTTPAMTRCTPATGR
ncbi:MAG TPA: hypothetical protein VFJ94_11725 [Intrasporangium sp.]|uniref:hypothetical protein n=1 Tax=Intrasporangium sp. TaxID=1925024 RepID=UPI002D76F571|nr:hypothetical protein [Intrasporangium sp.]HET7399177.1 hypothetical protein [Intrasporangium sp.]